MQGCWAQRVGLGSPVVRSPTDGDTSRETFPVPTTGVGVCGGTIRDSPCGFRYTGVPKIGEGPRYRGGSSPSPTDSSGAPSPSVTGRVPGGGVPGISVSVESLVEFQVPPCRVESLVGLQVSPCRVESPESLQTSRTF